MHEEDVLSAEALRTIKETAQVHGQDITSFVMGAAMERARAVLAEDRLLRLTPADVLQLERELDAEPRVIPGLANLIRRFGEQAGSASSRSTDQLQRKRVGAVYEDDVHRVLGGPRLSTAARTGAGAGAFRAPRLVAQPGGGGMGYTTDYVGHIDIVPPLNDEEVEYLTAFRESRRCQRPGGAYDVPGNPWAEEPSEFPVDDYNRVADGQPELWCNWSVCWDGCCLAWNGTEKSYAMVEWLRYLIAHFLRPRAKASGHSGFEDFTFDHRLDGMVVGCRRDDKELFAITVTGNRVTERVLRRADTRYVDRPPLAYEIENDRWAEMSGRRRRRNRTDAEVVDLRPSGS